MEEIKLEVQIRNGVGKSHVKKYRRQDFIPGIVYGDSQDPTLVNVDRRTFERIERRHRGESIVLHLDVMEGKKKLRDYSTIIKEIQGEPVSDRILHIDFLRISLTKEIAVEAPIKTRGEPVGVKKEGGSLDHVLWNLDIVCLPTNIPQHIEVDVSHLSIHDSILVKDLLLPSGVRTEHDSEAIVFTVVPPTKEEPEEKPEEEEAGEPEVIKEKKPEKEEEKAEEKESPGEKEEG